MYVFDYLRFIFKTQDFVMRLPINLKLKSEVRSHFKVRKSVRTFCRK